MKDHKTQHITTIRNTFFQVLILIFLSMLSCNEKNGIVTVYSESPVEKIVNYVTSSRDNLMIELPHLYDSLTKHIPDDANESMIVIKVLKKRGFKIIEWGRGNYPPLGPRIVSVTMQKGECLCQVDKIYYTTISDTLFQMTERIRCSDSLTFYKGDN